MVLTCIEMLVDLHGPVKVSGFNRNVLFPGTRTTTEESSLISALHAAFQAFRKACIYTFSFGVQSLIFPHTVKQLNTHKYIHTMTHEYTYTLTRY